MNRRDLETALALRSGVSVTSVRAVLKHLFGTRIGEGVIAEALDRGDRVVLSGFGTFLVRDRVGEELEFQRAPTFRPGAALRQRLR